MQALQERAPGPVPEDLVEDVRLAERVVVRGRERPPRRRVLDRADVDDVLLLELRPAEARVERPRVGLPRRRREDVEARQCIKGGLQGGPTAGRVALAVVEAAVGRERELPGREVVPRDLLEVVPRRLRHRSGAGPFVHVPQPLHGVRRVFGWIIQDAPELVRRDQPIQGVPNNGREHGVVPKGLQHLCWEGVPLARHNPMMRPLQILAQLRSGPPSHPSVRSRNVRAVRRHAVVARRAPHPDILARELAEGRAAGLGEVVEPEERAVPILAHAPERFAARGIARREEALGGAAPGRRVRHALDAERVLVQRR